MSNEVEDFLTGGGVRSAKFENIGDMVKGVICEEPVMRDQTDIKTGEVKRFPDGNPMKQVVLTIITDPLLHEDDDDDGLRRIYVKSKMTEAMRSALKKAGVRGPAEGGKIAVKFVSEIPPQKRGHSPTKVYQVWYEDPPKRLDMGDPLADDELTDEPF
jgi:hypothetical protein